MKRAATIRRAGRPPDPTRRDAILRAAAALFLREGFSGATMDEVARQAGVAKCTIYSHFLSKEDLISEAVREASRRAFAGCLVGPEGAGSIDTPLTTARRLTEAVIAPSGLELYCAVLGEVPRRPWLARIYWDEGPAHASAGTASSLAAWTDQRTAQALADQWIAFVLTLAQASVFPGPRARQPGLAPPDLDEAWQVWAARLPGRAADEPIVEPEGGRHARLSAASLD
jgi:TetR/AcrR family transcriptional regulator, mexJK operon transcriptional repressor